MLQLAEISEAQVNLVSSELKLRYSPEAQDANAVLKKLLSAVRDSGHDLLLSDELKESIDDEQTWYEEHRDLVLMIASGILIAVGLLLGLFSQSFPSLSRIQAGFYILAALFGVNSLLPATLSTLKRKKIDMNVLMTVAVLGAIGLGAYVEAAVVIFLDQLGEYLEGYSMRKTRGSIRKLMELAPERAHVWNGNDFIDLAVQEVQIGSRVQIRPGERIPLDGIIVKGSSAIDESPVTGESIPLDKGPGQEVYAGSLNTHALLEMQTSADAQNSMLARIVEMVEGAQAKKAPYEDFVDRFAAWYTPLVMLVALCIAFLPPLAGLVLSQDFGSFSRWIYAALTILVISCPCALVISTPVSFVSAITKAARMGVLVKGGAYLEIASKIDTVFFDKTGTLTQGKPKLAQIVPLSGEAEKLGEDKLLAMAALLERHSNHPLARAIVHAAQADDKVKALMLEFPELSDMQELAAKGVQAKLDEMSVFLGKPSYIEQAMAKSLSPQEQEQLETLESGGASVLALASQKNLLAYFVLQDLERPEAREALAELSSRSLKISSLAMLTGDNKRSAQAVAKRLGLDTYHAALLPEDKIKLVEQAAAEGRKVAMVGDGINDAPALAASQLGVTMGAAASDTALEVADLALMSADLKQLPAFLKLSKHTMVVVKENIIFAIAIKVLFLILALFGMTSMWMAVFADTGVTILVILNGMRLLLGKYSK